MRMRPADPQRRYCLQFRQFGDLIGSPNLCFQGLIITSSRWIRLACSKA